jgi:multisubunit Na+/H+ antiporter MnhF subunit
MGLSAAETPFMVAGLVGAALIVFGFYRTAIGRWTTRSMWYELDTIGGTILLIVYHLHIREYISLVLEVVIVLIAIKGVNSIAERNEERKKFKVEQDKLKDQTKL